MCGGRSARRRNRRRPSPFHDLRVTCVSILVAESDGDVAYVSRVLGASPAVLLSTYADLFDGVEKSAQVMARVDAVAATAVAGLA